MIISHDTIIEQAFDGYLSALLPSWGLTIDDVAWYNVSFTPNATKMYLRARMLLSAKKGITLGVCGYTRLSGLYQIDVMGVPNTGKKAMEEMKSSLLEKFPTGSTITRNGVRIRITSSYAGTPTADGLRPVIPLTVSWASDIIKQQPLEVLV